MTRKHPRFVAVAHVLPVVILAVAPLRSQSTSEIDKTRDLAIEAARKADAASEKATNAIDAANRRFDTLEKLFYVLTAMASLSLVGIAVAESRRRKTEQERFDVILRRQDRFDDITAAAATQQTRLVENQISLGGSVLLRSDEVLQKQIETMTKLGDVIKLVEDIFKSRLEQEKGRETLQKELSVIKQKMDREEKAAQAQLTDLVITPALSVEDLRRHDWPTLGTEERIAIGSARATFRAVAPEVLTAAIEEDCLRIAKTQYLLGVSAYYSNDVPEALRLLHASKKIYQEVDPLPPEHRRPAAFCFYYLGLIEKNWWRSIRPLDENFKEAMHFLEEADRRHSASDEFLTPLALIEVSSYVESERPAAQIRLANVLTKFDALPEAKLLDIHRTLRQRAYLLLGNLNLLGRQASEALAAFNKASLWWFKTDPEGKKTEAADPGRKDAIKPNHFALLSIGAISKRGVVEDSASESMLEGLRSLVQTGALDKPELTTRGSNLAWAAIASHLLSDERRNEYTSKFFQVMAHSRKLGDRIPLFFDPISKMLVPNEELVKSVKQVLEA